MTPKEMKSIMDEVLTTTLLKAIVTPVGDDYEMKLVVYDREYSVLINEKTARDPDLVKNYWAQLSAAFFREFEAGVQFLAAQEYLAKKDTGSLAPEGNPQLPQSSPEESSPAETDTALN